MYAAKCAAYAPGKSALRCYQRFNAGDDSTKELKRQQSLQTGPYLRTEEGEETAVLCNHDDLLDDSMPRSVGPDFEVVSPPGTPGRRHDDQSLLP